MEALNILLASHVAEVRPDLASELTDRGLRVTTTANQADTWAAARDGPDAVILIPVGPGFAGAELRSLLDLATEPEGPALVVLTDLAAELDPWAEQLDDFLSPSDDVDLIVRRLHFCVARRRPLRRLRRERQALLQETHTDFKTRLWNDRHFQERCRIEHARAGRDGAALSVLMIDVDEFKGLNDRHDHAFGDHALRTLAELLRQDLRPFDTPARLGGDEFGVLLPNTSLEDASRIAERLRARAAETSLAQGPHAARLTITIGVATWEPSTGESFEATRLGADQALLAAKRQGRNRVGVHLPPPGTRRKRSPSESSPRPTPRQSQAEG